MTVSFEGWRWRWRCSVVEHSVKVVVLGRKTRVIFSIDVVHSGVRKKVK